MAGQAGFFDGDERLKALSAAGDPLERLSRVVDFEAFREYPSGEYRGWARAAALNGMEQAVRFESFDRLGKGEGRPPLEHVIDRLGGLGVARQPTALGAHPLGEFIDQGCDTALAGRAADIQSPRCARCRSGRRS